MAIPIQFQQFKAAGIYRVVYDKSTVLGQDAEKLRLVVGYSPKGPFNIPTYINSVQDFKSMYGDISKTLEKRGCFFHRTCIQALSAGPILCLNLKKFGVDPNNLEEVGVAHIDTAFDTNRAIDIEKVFVEDIYDTTRFWNLDAQKLNELSSDTKADMHHYIHLATTDSKENSGSFFIRKASGSKVSGYDVTVNDWYKDSGDDIPEFLLGYEGYKMSDFFAEIYVFSGKFEADQVLASDTLKNYFETDINGNLKLRPYVVDAFGDTQDTLDVLAEDSTSGCLGHYIGSLIPYFMDKNSGYKALDLIFNVDSDTHNMMMSFDTDYLDEEGASVIDLSGISQLSEDTLTALFNSISDSDSVVYTSLLSNENSKVIAAKIDWVLEDYEETSEVSYNYDSTTYTPVYDSSISFVANSYVSSDNKEFVGEDASLASILSVGDRMLAADEDSKICFVQEISNSADDYGVVTYTVKFTAEPKVLSVNGGDYVVRIDAPLNQEVGDMYAGDSNYLEGYVYAASKPASVSMLDKLNWQKSIMSALTDYKGLRTALLSPAEIEFRYVVDSFESFVDSEVKSQLSLLAKSKELCFAILNFPSVRTFVKCPYASYVDDKKVFNVKYVVAGSNKKKPASRQFSLPTEVDGASYCAFYTPLKFSDGYVDSIIPSAGIVSNLFIDKFYNRFEYSIIAGPNYGKISYSGLVGPDYHYSQDELQSIEPFGVNCMIYRPDFGTFINANQTAKQSPKSALSSVNVRELVIHLQDEIGKVLQAYQWEFNNPTTRKAIKDRADIICETAKGNGGIQVYKNIIDESNNTADIIDNEMCVLSTHIEPGRGCGKMIHELTIYRTGGMSSSISEG